MLQSIAWYVYFLLLMLLGTFLFVSQGGKEIVFGPEILLFFTVLLLPFIDRVFQMLEKEKVFQANIWDIERYITHYIILAGILFSLWYGGFDIPSLIFLGIFLVGITFSLHPKIPFMVALILFIYIPFLLILDQKSFAEQLSIYAYYFLIIGVILQVAETVVPKIKKIGK